MFPFSWMTGERFPYTNLHNQNQDWIISILKEMCDKLPEMYEDITKKLNSPENAGHVGEFLMNIGNGETQWENMDTHFVPIITEAVNDWLNAHPEATTTVQDLSLTLQKLTPYAKYRATEKQSGTLSPVYIGDYNAEGNMLPSAVCYVDGYMYCVDAKQDDYAQTEGDGIGLIRKYSLADNEIVAYYQVVVGHGNSIAFDGTYFYIAPIWEYTVGSKTSTRKVYKYTQAFVLVAEVEAPATIMGVSYDSVAERLYALDYSGNIHYFNGEYFEPYTSITNWNDFYSHESIKGDTYYNQDIAIYDNNFYISSPYGNILHGMIQEAESTIDNFMQVSRSDLYGRWVLGELEGFEFSDGHLYTMMYTVLPSDLLNAFVMELPVNHKNCTSAPISGDFTVKDFTLTLSPATRAKFSLNTYEIRSIEQLFAMRLSDIVQTIEIPSGVSVVEDRIIYIPSCDIMLNLQGEYTCKKFVVSGGEFSIYCGAGNKLTLTNTGSLIELRRTGNFRLSGNNALLLSTPNIQGTTNNFINIGYNMPYVLARVEVTSVENADLYIGSNKFHGWELYLGSTPFIYMPNTFTAHYTGGYVSADNKTMRLIFHTPKAIRGTIAVTGTFILRGSQGYVDNIDTNRNITDFLVTIRKPDDYTIEVAFDKADHSAWGNIANNTPVYGQVNFTFTWT